MQAVNTAWGPIPARRVPRRVPRRPPARLALVARLPERAVCSVVCAPVGRPPVVSGKISVCGSRAYERPAMGGLARPLEEEGRTPLRAGDAPCAAAIEEEASVVPLVPDELSPTHCRCCYRYRPRPSAPLEFGKSASTRPLLHAARIARGDMRMHMCMCMWAPRGRLISMCAWICCAAYLSFLVFCSDASTVDTVVAMPASLLSRATLPLLDGVHIAIFIRAKHKGYMERDVRRVHELSCTIVAI